MLDYARLKWVEGLRMNYMNVYILNVEQECVYLISLSLSRSLYRDAFYKKLPISRKQRERL